MLSLVFMYCNAVCRYAGSPCAVCRNAECCDALELERGFKVHFCYSSARQTKTMER
jgi:hypothetical protein